MPVALHPHLKRRLDFNELYTDPGDGIEHTLPECQDAQEQAAKRRRVEAIATRYLCGKPPVILSAGLRGPFNNGWKNPWVSGVRATRATSERQSSKREQISTASVHNTIRAPSLVKAKIGKPQPRIPKGSTKRIASRSPEASRAARDKIESNTLDYSLEEVEVPPATAPSPEGPDASGKTEMCIHSRSPLTDPFWLRRPASQRQAVASHSANEFADASPTRSRSRNGRPQPGSSRSLRLAPAKAPLHKPSSQSKPVTPGDWRSSGSASMVFSSLVRAQDAASEPFVEVPECSHPDPFSEEPFLPKSKSKQPSVQEDSLLCGSQGRPSREDIQQSAERLVDVMAASSGSVPQPGFSNTKKTRKTISKKGLKHDLVASPAQSSSQGFVYRKVGEGKRTSSNTSRSVPKSVDFNSPPMPQGGAPALEKQCEQDMTLNKQTGASAEKSPREDLAPVHESPLQRPDDRRTETSGHDVREQNGTPDSSPASQESRFSTQAGMLLAHMEFHKSPCSDTSPVTPRPWLLPLNETPRSVWPMPSPAITPLSVFNEQIEKSFTSDSVSQDPPISTQDLFGAASPFAFSTIKKRPEEPRHSSLRFTLLQNNDEGLRAKNILMKSPTPAADRVPLKTKNVATSLWSFSGEKTSQVSQDSLVERSRRSISDVGMPMLLGESSLDSDVHFTDSFLRNLDGA